MDILPRFGFADSQHLECCFPETVYSFEFYHFIISSFHHCRIDFVESQHREYLNSINYFLVSIWLRRIFSTLLLLNKKLLTASISHIHACIHYYIFLELSPSKLTGWEMTGWEVKPSLPKPSQIHHGIIVALSHSRIVALWYYPIIAFSLYLKANCE